LQIKTLDGLDLKGGSETSILDSALRSQVNFEYSCKNGQCGACKATLLEGKVLELQVQTALSNADVKAKQILTCCCAPDSDIVIDAEDLTALTHIEIKTLPARINKIEKKTEKVVEIELRLPPTANLTFLEGQYIDISGPQGIRRSYSIANSASGKLLKIWIKKVEGGAFSQYWFNEAKANDLVRIEGPKGSFFFREPKLNIIFMATGTGIAPVKSILDKLAETPDVFSAVSFSLYWGNRNVDDFFWQPSYTSLNLNYTPVLSKENEAWQGRVGYIQDIVIEDGLSLEDTQVYACGSLQMIESASALLVENGLVEKQFYADAFVSS